MNLVGKIFVVLILIASTVFMTMGMMVYATHQNWLEAVMGKSGKGDDLTSYHGQLEASYKEQAKLRGDVDRLTNLLAAEKAAHLQALVKTENERDVLIKRAGDLAEEIKKSQLQLEQATKTVQVQQQQLTELRKEAIASREDIRNANKQTDEQLKIATQTEDKLHIALGQLADLKQRNEQLASDFAKANAMLKTFNVSYLAPLNREPPMLRGQILAIDKEDRAEISLGTDDGLREGHELEVYRGNKYLGRMKVVEAQAHRAIGMVLKEYKQETIRKGDEVATKLKA
jgi:chromosome segregation ATPase